MTKILYDIRSASKKEYQWEAPKSPPKKPVAERVYGRVLGRKSSQDPETTGLRASRSLSQSKRLGDQLDALRKQKKNLVKIESAYMSENKLQDRFEYSDSKARPLINSISAYKDHYQLSDKKMNVSKFDLDFGKSKVKFVISKPESDLLMKMDTEKKIQKMRKIRENSL